MAIFYILPTTDIHLVNDPSYTDAQQFSLRFLFDDKNTVFNSANIDLGNDHNQDIINVQGNYQDTNNLRIIITAVNVGLTFVRVKYESQECFIRVWVHQAINQIWVSNNHLSIYSGNDFHGYVASVFAIFSDNEICDITYHPYLTYHETDTTDKIIVNNHIIKHPDIVTSEQFSKIGIGISGKEDEENLFVEVDVTIKKQFHSDREILERVHIGDDTNTEHVNLLLIAEGFKDKSDFMLFVNDLKNNLIDNNVHSPWHFLKRRLTIWTAFESSLDNKEGVTVNYPISEKKLYIPNTEGGKVKPKTGNLTLKELIDKVGLPNNNSPASYSVITSYWPATITSEVDEGVFNAWKDYNKVKGYIENKDSPLGICTGERLGDRIKSQSVQSPPTNVFDWYNRAGKENFMNFDRRRYPYDIYDKVVYPLKSGVKRDITGKFIFNRIGPGAIDKYLGSLTYANAPVGSNKGETWQIIGKDSTLIAIVCNNYKWGGQYYSQNLSHGFHNPLLRLAVSMFNLSNIDEHRITIDNPNLPAKLSDNINAVDIHYDDFDAIRITGVMAHELMHSSASLGDEYEMYEGTVNVSAGINEFTNLMTIGKVKKNGSDSNAKIIDPKKIKWNLRRVALSSFVTSQVSLNGSLITVTVESDQISKWKKVKDLTDANGVPVNLPLYLRSSLYNHLENFLFYEIAIEYINQVNSNNNTIILKVADSELTNLEIDKFEYGCHIYLPKRLKNDFDYDPSPQSVNKELYIINPRVLEYIEKKQEALSVKTDCGTITEDPQFPITDITINDETEKEDQIYPDFCSPQNRFLVSGIYEGGIATCFTYRPSGNSLMRRMVFWQSEVDAIDQDTGEVLKTDSFNTPFLGRDIIAIYSRFDFFAKYCFLAMYYPTKLEDLDSREYHYYDSTKF